MAHLPASFFSSSPCETAKRLNPAHPRGSLTWGFRLSGLYMVVVGIHFAFLFRFSGKSHLTTKI